MIQLHDKELERKVLGAIMFDWQIWHEVADSFSEDLFMVEDLQNIAKVIIHLRSQGTVADIVTVTQEMKKRDYFSERFTPYEIARLTSDVSSVANTAVHVKLLQELLLKRKVNELAENAIRAVHSYNSDIFDIIEEYEVGLTKLTDTLVTEKIYTMPELFKDAIDINQRIMALDGALSGVTSGFRVIDQITGGWQPSDLIVLGADAGMGKSSLALEFAKRPALRGDPVGVLSGEMNARQLYARLISQESDMELHKVLRTGLNDSEVKTVIERLQPLNQSPLYIDDSNMRIFDVKNKARKMKRKYGIKLLIIDYLQLIEVAGNASRADKVSFISRQLKALAKELDIPIIAISSLLNKEIAKRPGKIPQKSDLRESGNIEFDADLICLLYRPEYYGIMVDDDGVSTAGKCMFMIEKHRNGALAAPVLGFEGRLTKFYSIGVDDPKTFTNEPKPFTPLQANMGFEEETDIIT